MPNPVGKEKKSLENPINKEKTKKYINYSSTKSS